MLPPEVLDHIFSFLQRDRAALKSCSTACPLWFPLVERHLLVHILVLIDYETRLAGIDGFLVPQLSGYLSKRPWLADHIRSITIDHSNWDFRTHFEPFKQLSTILPLIPRAEVLSLRHIRWFQVPEEFRSTVLDFLRSAHMKELDLRHSTHFPLTILDSFRNIKNLKLVASDFIFMNPTEVSSPTSLESLSLHGSHFPQFTAWAKLRVHDLISLHADLLPNLSPIFNTCSGSLRNLTLRFSSHLATTYYRKGIHTTYSTNHSCPFNLSVLARLEIITIHAVIIGFDKSETFCWTKWCVSSLPAISSLVRTAGPTLKSVVLNIDFAIGGVRDLCDGVEWNPLIHLCDYLSPRRVNLCIRSRGQILEVVESLSRNEDFSRLMNHGSLAIKPYALDLLDAPY